MKLQALMASSLSLFLYSAAFTAPVALAATIHHSGNTTEVADQALRPSMLTVVSSVRGGQPIQSSPLEQLKVNSVAGTVRNANVQPSQAAAQSATHPEPGTLTMLLTGLGVMGSIALRRRLAKKST